MARAKGTRTRRKRKPSAKPRKPKGPIVTKTRAQLQRQTHGRLFGALEMMRDLFARELGIGVTLQARTPPPRVRGTPWSIVGKFAFQDEVFYEDLYLAFTAMERSRRLESKVGRQRLARIQSRYRLGGDRYEWTVAEIGAWELVISRAVERTDPNGVRRESVGVRYDATNADTGELTSILIWLSSVVAQEVDFGI